MPHWHPATAISAFCLIRSCHGQAIINRLVPRRHASDRPPGPQTAAARLRGYQASESGSTASEAAKGICNSGALAALPGIQLGGNLNELEEKQSRFFRAVYCGHQ